MYCIEWRSSGFNPNSEINNDDDADNDDDDAADDDVEEEEEYKRLVLLKLYRLSLYSPLKRRGVFQFMHAIHVLVLFHMAR